MIMYNNIWLTENEGGQLLLHAFFFKMGGGWGGGVEDLPLSFSTCNFPAGCTHCTRFCAKSQTLKVHYHMIMHKSITFRCCTA